VAQKRQVSPDALKAVPTQGSFLLKATPNSPREVFAYTDITLRRSIHTESGSGRGLSHL
jgi:hypothetical protein